MGLNLAQKILKAHLVSGEMVQGNEIGLRIDQTLTQDATGTMAYLEFESMGIPRVRTELSVAYIDHNMLQSGFENADDHRYLQSVANKYGVIYSRCGNGICHQVHLERFGIPGKTLIGSDSHTPTGGGIGMLAMGAGGLDVAVAVECVCTDCLVLADEGCAGESCVSVLDAAVHAHVAGISHELVHCQVSEQTQVVTVRRVGILCAFALVLDEDAANLVACKCLGIDVGELLAKLCGKEFILKLK